MVKAAKTDLTVTERALLLDAEEVIHEGRTTFVEVGQALAKIRELRLYRDTHSTFELYCTEKWGWSKPYCTQVIQGAKTAVAIATKTDTPPENEAQVRPLSRLPEEERAPAWEEAVAEAAPEKPTGKVVSEVVERKLAEKKPKAKAPPKEPEVDVDQCRGLLKRLGEAVKLATPKKLQHDAVASEIEKTLMRLERQLDSLARKVVQG